MLIVTEPEVPLPTVAEPPIVIEPGHVPLLLALVPISVVPVVPPIQVCHAGQSPVVAITREGE